MVRNGVFRGTLASPLRNGQGLTVLGPVLRRTPGAPHLPPSILLFPTGRRKERWPPHAIVAQARYVADEHYNVFSVGAVEHAWWPSPSP